MPKRDDVSRRPQTPDTTERTAHSRRSILRALGAASAVLVPHAVLAQASPARWWENLPGFGHGGGEGGYGGTSRRDPSEVREKKVEPLNDLRPDSTPFRSDAMLEALDAAIGHYQKLASAGGWQPIPGPRMIRPGDDDERVPLVRRRLRATGEFTASSASFQSISYDGELEAAVRRYQERNGLRVSGRIDHPTIAAMNVSAQARVNQLKLNYTRLRELLQGRVEDRYVLVNIPAFQLEAVERFEVQQRHRVIVGREGRQTPGLKASIRALNFFPYWRVPDSVATLDLIPKLRKEPEYLDKEKIRVLTGNFNGPVVDHTVIDWNTASAHSIKFRQDPGPQNALGLVRIDMPNSEGVYMHDTPMKQLFLQRTRSFSAGCVRVQDVFKLASWIARGENGWDDQRVEDTLSGGQAVDVTLGRQIPVYFAYITAWAEPSTGQVEFRPDLYGRDGSKEFAGENDPDAPPPPSNAIQALAP